MFYETAESKSGFAMIRLKCKSDFNPLTTFRAYSNIDLKLKCNKNVGEYKWLRRVGVNLHKGYQTTKKIMAVSSRDLYQYTFYNSYPDGSIKVVVFETDHPVTPGLIRMRMPMAGFHLKPDPSDPTKTIMNAIIEANLAGNIPKFVYIYASGVTANGL